MVNFGIDNFLCLKFSFPVLNQFDRVDKKCAAFCFIFHIFACCMKKIHSLNVLLHKLYLFLFLTMSCDDLGYTIVCHIAQLAWRLLFVTCRGICNVRGQGHCSVVFDNFSVSKVRWLILASWIYFFIFIFYFHIFLNWYWIIVITTVNPVYNGHFYNHNLCSKLTVVWITQG